MKSKKEILVITMLLLVSINDAHAYLDPGTGSLLLQGLIAGILGILFSIKNFWARIKKGLSVAFSRIK